MAEQASAGHSVRAIELHQVPTVAFFQKFNGRNGSETFAASVAAMADLAELVAATQTQVFQIDAHDPANPAFEAFLCWEDRAKSSFVLLLLPCASRLQCETLL